MIVWPKVSSLTSMFMQIMTSIKCRVYILLKTTVSVYMLRNLKQIAWKNPKERRPRFKPFRISFKLDGNFGKTGKKGLKGITLSFWDKSRWHPRWHPGSRNYFQMSIFLNPKPQLIQRFIVSRQLVQSAVRYKQCKVFFGITLFRKVTACPLPQYVLKQFLVSIQYGYTLA